MSFYKTYIQINIALYYETVKLSFPDKIFD